MTWALIIGLAVVAFAFMAFAFRLPKTGWATAGAALALGLAGYAAQGSPTLPGAPKDAAPRVPGEGDNLVEMRRALFPQDQARQNALVTADAMARHDQYTDAASFLLGAVRDNPRDAESWLALGNVLVAQADGAMTPAAQFAYRRAEAAAPNSPGVPFFVGVAELNQGHFTDTRGLWLEAAKRAPEGSEARKVIEDRIGRLDALMERMYAMAKAQQQAHQALSGQNAKPAQ
jgi:cytochrome c-type biogenesis protein CcmH